MNRIAGTLVFCGLLLGTLLSMQSAYAQQSLPEAQLAQIRQNCVKAQTALSQLNVSDAGMRSSRGSLYETISTKLMAPLNSRIAYNRLSGLKLAATTLVYDKRFTVFQSSYRSYENAMTQTLSIKCEDQPEAFYTSVAAAREKRQKLHDDVVALNGLLQTYKNDFEDFAKANGGDAK